jgi:hypothetical protein
MANVPLTFCIFKWESVSQDSFDILVGFSWFLNTYKIINRQAKKGFYNTLSNLKPDSVGLVIIIMEKCCIKM